MENTNINSEHEEINIKDILFKYLAFWKWFVVGAIVALFVIALVNREKEKDAAKIAKARFIELLEKGKDGLIEVECFEFDKYGRILVNVFNDSVDDGSGDYTIGSGQIQGVWCDKNLKILLVNYLMIFLK